MAGAINTSETGSQSARGWDRPFGQSIRWLDQLLADRASFDLQRRFPHLSAMRTLLPAQARLLRRAAALLGIAGLSAPLLVPLGATALLFIAFALLTFWRIVMILVSLTLGRTHRSTTASPASPSYASDRTPGGYRPIYTVMVALYQEAAAVPGLSAALCALDWPQTRLDVLILMEEDDLETITAAEKVHWPMGTRRLVLPKGTPQTKPRALNFGLQHAKGRYVCIYDAEDLPAPSQLKAAHAAFETGPDRVACVQAPLVAYNRGQSWLAAHWSLEYAIQFSRLVPAQAALGLPILLGGTSNHFDAACLRAIGAWDAWNVTEDADLGIRLAKLGHATVTIDAPTHEEAPESLRIWIAQRSRWLKGFIVTWFVTMRRPKEALHRLGWTGLLTVQAGLLGTVLTSLAHAPLLAWCAISIAMGNAGWITAGLIVLFSGYAATFLAGLSVPVWAGRPSFFTLVTLPLYWPLHSLAVIRAIYGIFHAPAFWAKTPHGLTRAVAT
ncbi:MAG: glycosyltransferase [Pseudomonadota bacterium]